MKNKPINLKAKYLIRADKITPLCWNHVKKTFKKAYKRMQEAIKMYGAEKVIFGFSEDLRPVCELWDFR